MFSSVVTVESRTNGMGLQLEDATREEKYRRRCFRDDRHQSSRQTSTSLAQTCPGLGAIHATLERIQLESSGKDQELGGTTTGGDGAD